MARKLTYEEIKHFIETESNSGCKLKTKKEEYINTHQKLNIICACGKCFEVSYKRFKGQNKRQCNCCGIAKRNINSRLNYHDVKQYIEIDSGSHCQLISKDYTGVFDKMLIKCNCGNLFKTSFSQFKHKNKHQCNECSKKIISKKRRLSYGSVKNFIEVESNSGCKLLSKEYINQDKILIVKCRCGNQFKVTYNQFRNKNRQQCIECSNWTNWDYEKVRRHIETADNGEYELISKEYRRKKDKLYIKHRIDGNVFSMSFDQFHRGQRCPLHRYEKIAIKNTLTHEEFNKKLEKKYKNEYKLLSNYESMKNKIKVKHNICGHIWESLPDNILRHNICPKCASSKGENKILKYLDNNNMTYKIQYTFDDCRNKLPLPFDFYLPDYNLLIEYDGEHHFEPVNFGGISNDEALLNHKQTKQNDNMKNQYCLKNNIKLIRIPYWDFDNIEYILKEALSGEDSAYFIA